MIVIIITSRYRRTMSLLTLLINPPRYMNINIILIVASWSTTRVPGVLQRFAIAYFFAFILQWAFHITPTELDAKVRGSQEGKNRFNSISDTLSVRKFARTIIRARREFAHR